MIVAPGSTDVSIDIQIVDDVGLPVTGLVAATFPTVYWSLAGPTAATTITLSDLAAITSSHSDGGVKERSAGFYRLDLPDAALASAGTVRVYGESTGKRIIAEPIAVNAVSGGGSGAGAYIITITVDDGTSPLENALVRFIEGVNSFTDLTNASGVASFSLDAATYDLSITKSGYSYTPSNYTVSATASITRSMSAIAITPGVAPLCTGYMTCLDPSGNPEQNVTITIQAVQGRDVDGFALDGAERTAVSDASGLVTFAGLIRGATYTIRRGPTGVKRRFLVPDAATAAIAEILGNET
jgi:hypothetical protein